MTETGKSLEREIKEKGGGSVGGSAATGMQKKEPFFLFSRFSGFGFLFSCSRPLPAEWLGG